MASAVILGFAYDSPVTEFPVRTGPGTTFAKAPFTVSKGTANLVILDVQPDSQGTTSDFGRVYQWFNLQFPNGSGWMRGHVVGISGDLSNWGYGVVAVPTHAYTLARQAVPVTVSTPTTEININIDLESGTEKPTATVQATGLQSGAVKPTATSGATKPADSSGSIFGGGEVTSAVNTATKPSDSEVTTGTGSSEGLVQGTTKPTTPPKAIIKTMNAANTRLGPGLSYARGTPVPRNEKVDLLAVQLEQGGQNYRWFKFSAQGQQAWIREDLVTWEGDTEALGFQWDTYPAPMGDNRWWVRGWNFGNDYNPALPKHDGWDLGAQVGEPIYAGPAGGYVMKVHKCTKCTAAQPSSVSQGFSLGDASIWNDPAWGWGYGNFVIIRYLNEQLPESTRAELAKRGFSGGHIYVMYAHLSESRVTEGQNVTPMQIFAACGNTGNSEGPHVHLEIRASTNPNVTSWGSLKDNRMNPIVLFKR